MTVLAGTSKGIFRLAGGTFDRVQISRGVRDLFHFGSRTLAGTGDGLFVSDDDGRSWTASGLEGLEVWQIRSGGDTVLYAGTQPAGLYRSFDAGDSWEEVASFATVANSQPWCIPVTPALPGRARALVIDPVNPLRICVGVEVGGIVRTEDGGENWDIVLPGDNPDLHMMCTDPSDPDTVYASTGYGRLDGVADMIEGNAGVLRSTDFGASWEYAWYGITPRYSRPMCIDPRSPHSLTVASAPTAFSSFKDQGGAKAALYRSDDSGRSWRSLCDQAHSPCDANIHGLAPDPDSANGVIIGTDTGEVWGVTENCEWTQCGSGMPAVLSIGVVPQ